MKALMVMTLITSLFQPMQTETDILNLNTVVNWETDMEDDTMVLTLYTETGDMYVLEKEVN